MADAIICIRPEPGLSTTLERGREHGLEITGIPLFEIQPVRWDAPDPAEFDGLLIGSANAIRHGGPQLAKLLDLPVYAVGQATADMAERAGFQIAQVGKGGLQRLLDQMQGQPRRLLRLSGEHRVELSPCDKLRIGEIVVYRAHPLDAPTDLANRLESGPVILLHSAEAARHFSRQCSRLGVKAGNVRLAVLGQRIADAAGAGWKSVAIAPEPNDSALLAMIENMCQ